MQLLSESKYGDFVVIYIDATDNLLFDGNKYRKSEADKIADDVKKYFETIFKDKFTVYVGVDIFLNDESNPIIDPYTAGL